MPKYEDLKFIKDKVLNFGNEAMIRKEKGEPLANNDLPPEVVPESNPALDDIDSLLMDITDDLNEGLGYSEAPQAESEPAADTDSMTLDDLDDFDEDKLSDSLADISLDEALPDLDSIGNIDDSQWDDITDGSFEDLTDLDLDDEPSDKTSQNEDTGLDDFNSNDFNFEDINLDDTDNTSLGSDIPDITDITNENSLLNDNSDIPADDMNLQDISFDDIDMNGDNDGADVSLTDNDGTSETDALLAGLDGFDSGDNGTDDLASFSLDDNIIQPADSDSAESSQPEMDSLLSDLDNNDNGMGDFSLDDMNISNDNNETIPTDNPVNLDDDPMAGLDLTDIEGTDDFSSQNADDSDIMSGLDNDEFNPDNGLDFSTDSSSGSDNNMFSMDNIGGGEDGDFGSFNMNDDSFSNDDTDALLGGLNFGNDTDDGGLSFGNDDDMGLSFDSDDSSFSPSDNNTDDDMTDLSAGTDISDESYINDNETFNESDASDSEDDKTAEKESAPSDSDATNVVIDKDGSMNLTDAQRKQIIMSLSVMPKEAEMQIAKQIVSGEFSNEQMKPLIDALVNKEKVVNILRIYEKVTGDTSLAHIRTRKMSGQDFKEQEKSLSYQFKKNILPIISRLALIMIVLLSLILLYVKIIDPTFRASHYYKVGKQNITENKFDNVEPYFEEAYKLQPRYGQVLDYARLYRTAKRYKAAEVKYDNAFRMKPNKPLAMEMADFYREMKDYGTAVRRYEELKSLDDKDEAVLIGLGRTYLDWAATDRKYMETAKNIFQDIIDINDKNKDAVFYIMDIAIKENRDRDVMKYYNYIERNFEQKKVEDKYLDAYLNLADFMLKTKRYEEMQDILEKTAKNPKTKLMPRQEYTFSKLKKALNVTDEERIHLKNTLKQFAYMKTNNPLEYNTKENLNLLSDTYNALGENANKFSRGSIEAEQNFIKATQMNPLNGKAFYNLGNYELNYKATKDALESAKNNLRYAEKLGYTNDRLNFNLGWIAYKQKDFRESFRRLNPLSNRYTNNSNLKLFLGTVYYQMGNYDYAEAYLQENFDHFISLKQIHYPLDMELTEDRQIAEMLVNCANNLGAVHHKKYQRTRKTRNRDLATKYYEDSMEYYDKLKESKDMYLYEVQGAKTADSREVKLRQLQITYANQNLRNILYPAGNSYEPIIFEEFPLEYESSM